MNRVSPRNLGLLRLFRFAAICAAPLAGCTAGDQNGEPTGSRPFQDDWETLEYDFPYLDSSGQAQITNITIGGAISNNNFANRGDVIVDVTGPEGKITVEVRRFTMASSEEAAQEDFDSLELWAFNQNLSSPLPPSDMPAEANCTTNGWLNNCGIRIYYAGQTQLERAGADFRVTLPASYRHDINVITDDADFDADYHNRGNVCVNNASGSVDVTMGSGVGYVRLNPDTKPVPSCSDAGIEACNNWPTDGSAEPGSAAWAAECPCYQPGDGNAAFGRVEVTTSPASTGNITIDIPDDLWARINLENEGPDQDRAGQYCEATVDLGEGYELAPEIGTDETRFPWLNQGFFNTPSEQAVQGSGFSVTATSGRCGPVSLSEEPEQYVGKNNGRQQFTCERGDITVCTGCLASTTCADLLDPERLVTSPGCRDNSDAE